MRPHRKMLQDLDSNLYKTFGSNLFKILQKLKLELENMYAKHWQWFLKSKTVLNPWDGDGAGVVWINPVVLLHSCAAMPSFPNKTEASAVANG